MCLGVFFASHGSLWAQVVLWGFEFLVPRGLFRAVGAGFGVAWAWTFFRLLYGRVGLGMFVGSGVLVFNWVGGGVSF